MFSIKEGVSLQGLQIEMREVLIQMESIFNKIDKELVITSGTEGLHSATSLHYYGYALDFRKRHLKENEKARVLAYLYENLHDNYRIIDHDTHYHIEFRGNIK
jgi:hypothetical protein